MATVVTHSIGIDGGTYDYASASAWEAAQGGNLVSADEVRIGEYQGDWSSAPDSTFCEIDGSTCDATRYLELRADSANRATLELDATKVQRDALLVWTDHTRITGIQVVVASNFYALAARGAAQVVDSCVIYGVDFGLMGNGSLLAVNTFAHGGYAGIATWFGSGDVSCYGCSAHATSDSGSRGFYSDGGSFEYVNCYGTFLIDAGTDIGSSNNAAANATTPPGSGPLTSVGDAFVNFAGGDFHTHPTAGAALIGAGIDMSAVTLVDALGQTRPALPTIGAHELAPAGGTTDGSGSGSIAVSATGTGAASAASVASSAVVVSSSAVGGSIFSASGSASVVVSAAGVGSTAGSTESGDGAGAVVVSASAVGAVVFSAAGSAAVTVTSAGIGATTSAAAGSSSTTISAAATGSATHAATGSAAVVVSASAVGDAATSGSGVGASSVTLSASGVSTSVAEATGLSGVTVSATGLSGGTVVESVGSSALTVSGSAVGTGLISGVGSASLAVSGSGSASSVASGVALASVVFSGAATGSATAGSIGSTTVTVTATAVSSGLIRPDPPTITTWQDDPDAPTITAWADGTDPPIIVSWALNDELPIAA